MDQLLSTPHWGHLFTIPKKASKRLQIEFAKLRVACREREREKKVMQCNGGKEKSDLNKSEEQMGSEWWRQKPGEWSGNKLLSHGEIKVGSSKIWDALASERKKKSTAMATTNSPERPETIRKLNSGLLAVPNVSPDVPKCKLSPSTMAIH